MLLLMPFCGEGRYGLGGEGVGRFWGLIGVGLGCRVRMVDFSSIGYATIGELSHDTNMATHEERNERGITVGL